MAQPKRRSSHARKNKRRAHHAVKPEGLSVCPNCQEPKLPHRVCERCGYYQDRQVVESSES